MANTRFMYVRQFEEDPACLRNTYMVVRVDGRGFTKFTKAHGFTKPNDVRALALMNRAALDVAKQFSEIFVAFGQSDEYSFAFRRDAQVFGRRQSKILSMIVSLFSAAYVFYWTEEMGKDCPLTTIPQFDGRIVLYPSLTNLADYFRWRQADCHINNLYNTVFWALVNQGGYDERAAEQKLSGTVSKDKHEIMFSQFGINYNNEPAMFRKGSLILRHDLDDQGFPKPVGEDAPAVDAAVGDTATADLEQEKPKRKKQRAKARVAGPPQILHVDFMKDGFWDALADY